MLTQTLAETARFLRENDWRTILARMNARDTHPLIQFIKYGICGVLATVAHNGSVALLTLLWLPAAKGMLVNGVPLDDATRASNLELANIIAFPAGVVVAYVTNVLWVFTTGKHSRVKEFALFAFVSALGFFPGLLVVDWLAYRLGLPSVVAQLGFILTSVLVNFLSRKFIIFKG